MHIPNYIYFAGNLWGGLTERVIAQAGNHAEGAQTAVPILDTFN